MIITSFLTIREDMILSTTAASSSLGFSYKYSEHETFNVKCVNSVPKHTFA